MTFTESIVEEAALHWLESCGYTTQRGMDFPAGEAFSERKDYTEVVLEERLRQALQRLNPDLPPDTIDYSFGKILRVEGATLEARNRAFHRLLVNGVTVEYNRPDGSIAGAQVRLFDFEAFEDNDWLAVNQFTVVENKHNRRPDIVVFVNGLPLAVIELKNAADENATIWTAYQQLQTYQNNISSLFTADEAHRSQYDFIDGFARHMRDALPNASFIGFTGTPIELTDKNTRAVFGDYISIYDIQRAVEDKATVPIYYESRLAKLELVESEKPTIDPEFEEVTEGEEVERKEKLKRKWAQLEAIVGSKKRLKLVAEDIVDHFEKRLDVMEGKAMIVCMSRRICVELYRELVALRPKWHQDDDDKGTIKVIMTGSASDPLDWQPHVRNKSRREELAKRFRDPKDPFKVVLVRDMWLTGFDAPSLHTMYLDKPMRGHGLMQAIARVNRVFHDKPGGACRGLPRVGPRVEAGTGDLYRKRRHGKDSYRSGRGCGDSVGKVRNLLRDFVRLRLVEMGYRHLEREIKRPAGSTRTCPRPRKRQRAIPPCGSGVISGLCLVCTPQGSSSHSG